ncbi:MAG: PhzF family phenazine biosynthesis protein [Gemmatimonadota bacterium]
MHLWIIDAFTDRPFAGNPAAVCLLPEVRPEQWLQAVAAEMNLSETAFLVRGKNGFRLRWFTPETEVDLCGHATLASAHFLWEEGHLKPRATARFHTRSGLLTAQRRDGWITLDFPATPAVAGPVMSSLLEALGADARPVFTGRSRFDHFLVFEEEAIVRSLAPDFAALRRHPERGVIVTAPSSTPGVDFVSRFFAPGAGVAEDPVTGSAHCALAPYWAERLGRTTLTGFQASTRGGTVRVEMKGERVLLSGQAVTVMKGGLSIGEP